MMSRKTFLMLILTAAVIAESQSVRAIKPCPQLVPAFAVYPMSGSKAITPRNVAIFLYRHQKANLTLREKQTKTLVPFRLVTQPASTTAHMIPAHLLRPETTYEVRGVQDGPHSEYPYTLTTFTTSRTIDRSIAPIIRATRVYFSAIHKPRSFHHAMDSSGSRSASIKLVTGQEKPAAIEMDIAFQPPGKAPAIRRRLFYGYQPTIHFATTSVCPTWMPWIPNHGQYTVKVTPWSSTGLRGETLALKGRITDSFFGHPQAPISSSNKNFRRQPLHEY